MISETKSRKACKIGVILVISFFTELPCSSAAFPVELQYLTNRNTNKHEILHAYVFNSGNVHNLVIFSLTILLLVLLIAICLSNTLLWRLAYIKGNVAAYKDLNLVTACYYKKIFLTRAQ